MEHPPIGVIVNPKASSGKAIGLLPRIVSALEALRRPHHIHVTTAPGEATAVAQRFAEDGAPLVLAVGGDGTVNEIANGLIASGRPTCLGIIPAGRGSDFVRAVGSPRDVPTALAHLLQAKARRVDVGRVTFEDGTSRVFVNAAGLGFDAAVAERAHGSRMPGSTLPYLRGVAGALLAYRNIPVRVTADGDEIAGRALSVVVANGPFLGGGMRFAPPATIADGLLDLVYMGDVSKLELLQNMPRVYRGTHLRHPKVIHRQVRSVRIETATPARFQLDGELLGTSPVTLTVEPRALFIAE